MAKVEWFNTAKYCLIILNMLGLCRKQDNDYGFNVHISITYLFLVIIFFDSLCQTINFSLILTDLTVLTSIINMLTEKYIAISKAYQLLFHAKQFRHIIRELNTKKFQPANKTQVSLATKCLKTFNIIFIAFSGSLIANMFLYSIFPILDKKQERRFLSQAWYPYDSKMSPLYEITYVYQCISIYIIGLIVISVDLFICFQYIFIGCQFDLLCDKLISTSKTDLIHCIKQHYHILSLVKNCNNFWNLIFFEHLVAGSIILGVNLFQLNTLSAQATEFYAILIFEIGASIELFIYCWFANNVKIKSDKLLYAVFQSNWTEWPLKSQKNLLFFMMKVTKPLEISVFNTFYLSVETFLKIIKAGWSLFTLVNQVSLVK